ncbi:putative DNA-binding domain-containing protein [Sphingorhabdus sp.]|uniref:HvfC/BufC family peptide modification chaperone n=1 Tax=Sphingorhabdus sp. TaxID=1902408 RepID=UPI0032B85325
MPSLSEAQRIFVATINEGPDALDATLFIGSPERIILGLKAHANTISHARLVALEQSFPLTRAVIGETQFNALSRGYDETAEAKACDLAHIGRHFAMYLSYSLPSSSGERLNASICDLAKIEWAWLESYHAADASPLTLEAISKLAEADLLSLAVTLHPSVRICPLRAPLAAPLTHLTGEMESAAILVVRPDAEVRLLAIDERTLQAAQNCLQHSTIGNLLVVASEQGDEADPIGPVLTLIGAGALVAKE